MKILAFTDLHASRTHLKAIYKKADKADIIVCCGDFSVFESEAERILAMLGKLKKPVLIIHGNHESEEYTKKVAEQNNLTFLHKAFFEQDGYVFAGFGGGGFSIQDPEFEQFGHTIQLYPKKKKLILISHGPPKGCNQDLIDKDHVGCKSRRDIIKKLKPDLVLFGHIHETFHVHDRWDSTLLINPGPDGELIEL